MSPECSTTAVSTDASDLYSLKKSQFCCLKPDIASFSSFSVLPVLFVFPKASLGYSTHHSSLSLPGSLEVLFLPFFVGAFITLRKQTSNSYLFWLENHFASSGIMVESL